MWLLYSQLHLQPNFLCGLFRLGQDSSLMDGRPGVKVSDVKVSVDKLQITFSGSKTDQTMVGDVIILDRVVSSPKCALCHLYVNFSINSHVIQVNCYP